MLKRRPNAIETPNHQHVAGPQGTERAIEARALGRNGKDAVVAEHPLAPGASQCIDLRAQVSLTGGHARIADQPPSVPTRLTLHILHLNRPALSEQRAVESLIPAHAYEASERSILNFKQRIIDKNVGY